MHAILEALNLFVTDTVASYGLLAVFILMALESACIPIPSEVTMLYAGYLVSQGDVSFIGIVAAGVFGNLFGSWIIYAVGASGGRSLLLHHGRWFGVKPKHVDHADKWFDHYGNRAVFIGRLLPIIRTFISLPAGVSRMPIMPFTLYTFLGCIPFVTALAAIGVALGPHWEKAHHILEYGNYIIAATIIGFVLWMFLRWRKNRAKSSYS